MENYSVIVKPSAGLDKITDTILALGTPTHTAIIVVIGLNDLCEVRPSARHPEGVWRDDLPNFKQKLARFTNALHRYRMAHVCVGGEHWRWKAPPTFNDVRDQIREVLGEEGFSSDDGEDLYSTIVVGESDTWHATNCESNKVAMTNFLLSRVKFLMQSCIHEDTLKEIQNWYFINHDDPSGPPKQLEPSGEIAVILKNRTLVEDADNAYREVMQEAVVNNPKISRSGYIPAQAETKVWGSKLSLIHI